MSSTPPTTSSDPASAAAAEAVAETGPELDPETDPSVTRSHLGFPVVGIGASAGGLGALQQLLDHLPTPSGMAFVVVMHLSPDHPSSLDMILQRHTAMPVQQVTDSLSIEVDHVYLISPSSRLSMTDGQLRVTNLAPGERRHGAIDHFFRSLAEAHHERAVCVVLSGTGSDGTQGLKRVKELGGVTLVQSPADAEYEGMPRSAIGGGEVDGVLPAGDIGQRLVDLWENARRIELPPPFADLQVVVSAPASTALAEDALIAVKSLLRERTGHDFTHYKRATVMRRIERRMQLVRVTTLPAYLRHLTEHLEETAQLLQDMLISVTNFFRDRDAFEALERELGRTALVSDRTEPFRAWVVGCATGEEAYSVAMLLWQRFASHGAARPVQVFASDIDQRAIAVARGGVYASSIVTDVTPSRLRDCFQEDSGQYRIAKGIRDTVVFAAHNALSDPPFTRVDLVCCRNLLIYLDRVAQEQLLRTLGYALNPGGLLFLGSSETAESMPFDVTTVDKKHRLYRVGASTRAKQTLPLQLMSVAKTAPASTPLKSTPLRGPEDQNFRRVMSDHTLPSVLIDREQNVLHIGVEAAHLLRVAAGRPTRKLMTLIRPELRTALQTAIFRAAETGKRVQARSVRYEDNGEERHVHISVRPFDDPQLGLAMVVLFDETELSLEAGSSGTSASDPLISALQAELDMTTERLSGSLGESASSSEELRSMNEELRSSNEELRSATEELETGKEELQSVNEELITTNQELKSKIDETAQMNDDLNNLVASMDLATLFVDRSLRIKRYSPRATALFNIIASDLGRPLLDITHRFDYPDMADDVAHTLKTLQPFERQVTTTNGGVFLSRLLPYRTSEDRIDGAVLNFIDVTSLHAAQQQLRDNERQLRLVAKSMRDYAIMTFDLEGKVTSWNAGAEAIFGYTAAEIAAQPCATLFTPEDRAAGVPDTEMRRARDEGRADDERWHLRKGGDRFYASGIMTPLVEDGTLHGYAKIARDLTASKLIEAEREASLDAATQVRSKLEEASALKDEFLAVMSHELKNPLNLIQMNAEMLLRIPQAAAIPVVARAARIIRQSVSSQAQIIDDLLDLSRLNTGKFNLNPGPVHLRPVVEHIVEAVRAEARAKRLSVSVRVADLTVRGDQVRIEQIVWNLISNAQKFTPDGGAIDIVGDVHDEAAVLKVTDTGMGLEPAFLSEVFEMFRQADSGISRQRGGLGIGLALVKRLAELHGGTASAASDGPGRGATFTVSLPLYDGDAGDTQPPAFDSVFNGLRVLVVEDNADALEMFTTLLGMEGASVAAAASGDAALKRVAAERFDLIISDLSMPGMDGYTLARQLRTMPALRPCVLVALSGMSRPEDHKRAIDAGFDAHFAKPVEIDRLLDGVRRLLEVAPEKRARLHGTAAG